MRCAVVAALRGDVPDGEILRLSPQNDNVKAEVNVGRGWFQRVGRPDAFQAPHEELVARMDAEMTHLG